jgi:predicted esterase YcpF (UPF0227 family)
VYFSPTFVDELRELENSLPAMNTVHDPHQHWAIVAQGDEVLDWREMQAFCAHAQVRLLPGSDHALSDFEQHLDALMDFLNLAHASPPSA